MIRSTSSRIKVLFVMLFLLAQPMVLLAGSVAGDASDWGETIGDVYLRHSWGFGSSANITTDNTTLDTAVFRLSVVQGTTNVSDQDVDDGYKFNLSISEDYKLSLDARGAYWVNATAWNINKTEIDMYAATPVLGDLDGDGDLDAMVGTHINDHTPSTDDGRLVGFNNTGSSSSPNWTLQGAWNFTNGDLDQFPVPALGDMDGDGDLDMMVSAGDGKTYGIENTGNSSWPQWTANTSWNAPDEGNDAAAALGDIDDDGDLDLFVGSNTGNVVVYNNTGSSSSPAWTEKTAWLVPDIGSTSNPSLGDLDDDGDLDILVGDWLGVTRGFENTGTNRSPSWTRNTAWDIADTGDLASPCLGDLDDDGDLDLLVGDYEGDSYAFENQPRKVDNGTFRSNALGVGYTVNWTKVDWGEFLPANTDVDLYARTGNSTDPEDGTWSSWSSALSTPGGSSLDLPYGTHIQVRAELTTANNTTSPEAWAINLTYKHFASTGTLVTSDLAPTDLISWGTMSAVSDPKGQTIDLSYSTNSGSTWTASPGDGNLSAVDTTSGKIRFRANLTTDDVMVSPTFTGINITYMRLLSAHHLHLDPTYLEVEVGATHSFTAELHDINNNTLDETLTWTTTVGAVDASGGFTAQTTPGQGFVNVSFGSLTASAQVVVLVGPLHHLDIEPDEAMVAVGDNVEFTAKGYDSHDNEITGLSFNWSTDVGTVVDGNLTAGTTPMSGVVNVSVGAIVASANVTVVAGPLDSIEITPDSVVTASGKTTEFSATGRDAYLNVIGGLTFNWSTDVGTVNPEAGPNTTFTARQVGNNGSLDNVTGLVTAAIGAIDASADITIVPEGVRLLSRLEIEPGSVTIRSDQTLVFNITGYDQMDEEMDAVANWTSDVGTMAPASGNSSTLTPNVTEGNGTVTATVGALSVSANVTIVANASYPYPKIVGHVPDQEGEEDGPAWDLNLNSFEGGLQADDNLLWHIEDLDTTLVTVRGEYETKDIISFHPVPNAYGSDMVLLVLEDKQGFRATQEMKVTITPANDPPILNPIPDLMIRYDNPYKFHYITYISDIDDPMSALKLSVEDVQPADKPLTTSVSAFNITFNAPESLKDQNLTVTIGVSDGKDMTTRSIKVKVSDNWVPQLMVPLPDVTLTEGEKKVNAFDLDDHFLDKDKDVIFFTYGNNHVKITINEDHTVDIEADSEWYGHELVTFRATDSKGALVEDDSLITVVPFDDSPVIVGVPDLMVHYDSDYFMDLKPYITDVDTADDKLSLSFSDTHVAWMWDPDWMATHTPRSDKSRLTMVVNLPHSLGAMSAPYDIEVTITVSDGPGEATDTIIISVTNNWPPLLESHLPDVEFEEDTSLADAFRLQDHFRDPEGGTLAFSAKASVVLVTIGEDGMVDFSAPKNWFGTQAVTFRATDINGAITEDTILVLVLPVNDPPVLDPIQDIRMMQKNLTSVPIDGLLHDVDDAIGRLLIEVTSSDPSLSAFMSGTDIVIFAGDAGNFTITVKVTDAAGASAEQTFDVTVDPEVTPPQPPPPDGDDDSALLGWLLPILLLIIIIAVIIGAVVGYRRYYGSYEVDDSFVILKDGRLLSHISLEPVTKKDETIFSGMVAAIQLFIEDAFSDVESGPVKDTSVHRMEHKGNTILVEKGDYVYLALLIKGTAGTKLYKDMRTILAEIESTHGKVLTDWDGDMTQFDDISKRMAVLIPGGYTNPVRVTQQEEGQKGSDGADANAGAAIDDNVRK